MESRIQDCRRFPYLARYSVDILPVYVKKNHKLELRFLDKLLNSIFAMVARPYKDQRCEAN